MPAENDVLPPPDSETLHAAHVVTTAAHQQEHVTISQSRSPSQSLESQSAITQTPEKLSDLTRWPYYGKCQHPAKTFL